KKRPNNQKICYNTALLTKTLIEQNSTLDNNTKITLLTNSLRCFTSLGDTSAWDDNTKQKMARLFCESALLLSMLHADNNNYKESFRYLYRAIKRSSRYSNNAADNEILNILTLKQRDKYIILVPEQHMQWTTTMLHLIYNPHAQDYFDHYKNYDTLP